MNAYRIINVLDQSGLGLAADIVARQDEFVDGKHTATGLAKELKDNLEVAHGAKFEDLSEFISDALTKNEEFMQATFFRGFSKIILSRYDTGMHYGVHVDAPSMEGMTVDFSFTLFLTEPSEYEGGELVIYFDNQKVEIKPRAGELVLYSTNFLHEVLPVSKGARTCVVGWVSSFIGCPIARQALETLHDAAKQVLSKHNDKQIHLKLLQSYANLHRSISR